MSGRGKGGKGLGKGGAKRHRKVLRDNIQGITKPAIRRLCRRGGVKRISGLTYEETRGVLKVFLENVIRDSVTYTEHARRKTVTARDVVFALKKQGRTLYGFGSDTMFFQSIRPKARRAPSATPPPPPGPSFINPIAPNRPSRTPFSKKILDDCGNVLDSCCNVGLYLDEISKYFDNFNTFNFARKKQVLIQHNVIELFLVHKRNDIEITANLKFIDKAMDLNLVYDYFIQFVLNEGKPQYPNINRPTNLFKFKSQADYDKCALDFNHVTLQDIQQNLTFFDQNSDLAEILEQSTKEKFMFCYQELRTPHYYTLDSMINQSHRSNDFWQNDSVTAFFQIYSFLRSHQTIFTHYNLTTENIVLTYVPTKHYDFIYKENDATIVEFSSNFLIKINDFSKSVMLDITDNIYNDFIIKDEPSARQNGYNDVIENLKININKSEDLSLINGILKHVDALQIPVDLKTLFRKVRYRHHREQPNSGNRIGNVEGMYQELLQYLQSNPVRRDSRAPDLYGTFTIHTDLIDHINNIQNKSFEFKKK